MSKSELEDAFAFKVRVAGLPTPERDFRFHPTRRWKLDFAWKDYMLAAEVEGGVWTNGRHTRGAGFIKDCIKYNEAAVMGWVVLRFAGAMITDGVALECLERMIERLREANDNE